MSIENENQEKSKNLHLINEQIKVTPVLLVDNEENKVVEIEQALEIAKEEGLDLVLINDKATPPIVKILDYGKFLYEIKKKKKNNQKSASQVKSVTVKPQISEHDMGWKAEKAVEWLKTGNKVQFVVKAPGRMSERLDLINDVYKSFANLVEKYGKPKDELKKISKIQYATYFFPIGKK